MKKFLLALLAVAMFAPGAWAVTELDATVPANSALISTFAGTLRETRATVNEIIANIPDIANWTNVTVAHTATSGDKLLVNTSAAPCTITLPASPSAGDFIYLADAKETWPVYNVTLSRNGSMIAGVASNYVLDRSGIYFLMYVDAGYGWLVTSGGEGIGGALSTAVFSLSSYTYTDLADVIIDIATTPGLLIIDKNITLSTNASIPATLKLYNVTGNVIAIVGGKVLTFVDPSQILTTTQIFSAGSAQVVFSRPGTVLPEWWGAKADATDAAGTTDAIQAAITAAAPVPTGFDYDDQSDHAGVVKLACGHYLIDTPLVLPNNVVGLSLEGECGAMHGFGQTVIQWAGETMSDSDDWMIDAGSVMGFRLSRIHLIGNADDDNATSRTIQNGVFVRRVNSGFFASGNMWEDVTVRRFPGIGVQFGDYTVQDSGTGSDTTNTDNSYIKNLMIQDCRIGMVIDSPNFIQVLFDRLLISNYGGNPVSGSTPIEQAGSAPIKFRTKNAVQILHGYFHAVEASLYASYADDDNHSQYAIYALDGSFSILSGYSEARFLAYVAEGDETQGQQEINTISNFHLFSGEAGGPATPGKYPIYYRKSYMPLLLNGTRNIWVMEDPISAGVISVGCKVETKFLSRYMLGGNWWEQFTRNPNSYDWGLMTMTHNSGNLRWNVSSQIGAAGTSFDSPDGKTFRLLNNLIRSTYVDENGTESLAYYVSPGEQSPGVYTTVSMWDFGEDGIRARHLLGAIPESLMTEADIANNDFGECRYSSSLGEPMLLFNGWTEYSATRKVGYRFGLDRRQIQFWGELNGNNATAAEILTISGIVKCEDIRMADGESFHVAANGNGEFLPLKFTCSDAGETGDYITMAHGDWPDNSTRIDRVSLDGITIFVK